MSRELRLAYPGAHYHVMARGNEKRLIYRDAIDRHQFLKFIAQTSAKLSFRLHAYCLMPNHFHFFIETPKANISKIMHELNGNYAMYFNLRHKRIGHLFQGRFKSKLVDTNSYFLTLSRYVHRNPLKEKATDSLSAYPWSSYSCFLGKRKPPAWLAIQETLDYFPGKTDQDRVRGYRNFVERENTEADAAFENIIQKDALISGTEFKDWVMDTLISGLKNPDHYELSQLKYLQMPNITIEDICRRVDHIALPHKCARKLKTYLLRKHTTCTLKELANLLNFTSLAAITLSCRRFAEKLNGDNALRECVVGLEKDLGVTP